MPCSGVLVLETQQNSDTTYRYMTVSVLSREGTITVNREKYQLKKGSHFILPNKVNPILVNGCLEWIVSHP